jgi:hypothetical protein
MPSAISCFELAMVTVTLTTHTRGRDVLREKARPGWEGEQMHLGAEAMVVATVLSFGLAIAGREVYDFFQWKRNLRQLIRKLQK